MPALEAVAANSGSQVAQEVVGMLMKAIDTGCRMLWGETVAGSNVTTVQELAVVLHTFIGELARTQRKDGDVPGGIKYTTISMVSRGLCELMNRAPQHAWADTALLESLKASILEEMLASYEHAVRTRVLHKKTM